jgi:hypothetical protein
VKQAALLERLVLRGLEPAPSQSLGNVRLVPLLRRAPRDDLRISRRRYGDRAAVVDVGDDRFYGCTYVPHAFVVGFTDDGSPVATYGASLAGKDEAPRARVTRLQRMAKREDDDRTRRLRLLPQHLAFEGLLGLCFGGPEIAWEEYSKRALSRGLSPRTELSWRGELVPYLADAVRMFEIHDEQSGVLLYVGDQLAEVFVVSHPDDYRELHATLVCDAFCDTLLLETAWTTSTPALPAALDARATPTIAAIRAALGRFRREVGVVHLDMAAGVVGRALRSERVYRAGPFSLQRFMTALDLSSDDHIGEAIVRDDGTLEYAETYRLSAAQQKRAHLLSTLEANAWNLDAAAAALRQTKSELLVRLEKAGFGHLIAEHVLAAARKKERRR